MQVQDRGIIVGALTAVWSVIGGLMSWLTEWATEYGQLVFVVGSIIGTVSVVWQMQLKRQAINAAMKADKAKADYYSGGSDNDHTPH